MRSDVFKLTVKTDKDYSLEFNPMLSDILGFGHLVAANQTKTATLPLQLKSFAYNMLVYCDIVSESTVGGTREKILRVVPMKSAKFMENNHYEFKHIDYVPVASTRVEDIDIKIYSDYGKLLPLVDGRCYVKLHFRKKAR